MQDLIGAAEAEAKRLSDAVEKERLPVTVMPQGVAKEAAKRQSEEDTSVAALRAAAAVKLEEYQRNKELLSENAVSEKVVSEEAVSLSPESLQQTVPENAVSVKAESAKFVSIETESKKIASEEAVSLSPELPEPIVKVVSEEAVSLSSAQKEKAQEEKALSAPPAAAEKDKEAVLALEFLTASPGRYGRWPSLETPVGSVRQECNCHTSSHTNGWSTNGLAPTLTLTLTVHVSLALSLALSLRLSLALTRLLLSTKGFSTLQKKGIKVSKAQSCKLYKLNIN